MQDELPRKERQLPTIVVLAAGALTIVGFWSLLAFGAKLKAIGSWPTYLALGSLYVLLQIFVEGLLGAFWESNRVYSKLFAVAVIVAFYIFLVKQAG